MELLQPSQNDNRTDTNVQPERFVSGSRRNFLLLCLILFSFACLGLQSRINDNVGSVSSKYHSDNDNDDDESTTFIPQYLLHMGIEGTGHHFFQTLVEESPLQKAMPQPFKKHRKNVCMTIKKLFMDTCNDTPQQNPDGIFTNLVTALVTMDNFVKTNGRPQPKMPQNNDPIIKGSIVNFEINGARANGCHLSSPMHRDPTCRNLQFLGLDIFHKACRVANVTCGHVIIVRNPYAILQSAYNRGFVSAIEQLPSMYAAKLKVIAAEMMMHREKLVACFDYDDPENVMVDGRQGNLFGWNVRDGSLKGAIERLWLNSNSSGTSSNDVLPPKFRSYMDAMIDSNNMIRQMCAELLD